MNAVAEWLKLVPTSFVGAKYEPLVELLSFMLVLLAFLSVMARILTRPSMAALAQRVWSLLREADSALKHATLYAPEAEHYRRRAAPYFLFISPVVLFAILTVYILVFLVALPFAFRPGIPWYAPVIILSFLSVMMPWGRIHLSSASWAWHAIKTGEERPPRTLYLLHSTHQTPQVPPQSMLPAPKEQ